MHLLMPMSPRAHLGLRMLALLLLAGAAFWPRSRGALSAAELAVGGRASTTRTTAAHAETTAARLVRAPGKAKIEVAEADQSNLTN